MSSRCVGEQILFPFLGISNALVMSNKTVLFIVCVLELRIMLWAKWSLSQLVKKKESLLKSLKRKVDSEDRAYKGSWKEDLICMPCCTCLWQSFWFWWALKPGSDYRSFEPISDLPPQTIWGKISSGTMIGTDVQPRLSGKVCGLHIQLADSSGWIYIKDVWYN